MFNTVISIQYKSLSFMLGSQEVRELLAHSVAVCREESFEGRDGADGERFFYSSQAKTLLILKNKTRLLHRRGMFGLKRSLSLSFHSAFYSLRGYLLK